MNLSSAIFNHVHHRDIAIVRCRDKDSSGRYTYHLRLGNDLCLFTTDDDLDSIERIGQQILAAVAEYRALDEAPTPLIPARSEPAVVFDSSEQVIAIPAPGRFVDEIPEHDLGDPVA